MFGTKNSYLLLNIVLFVFVTVIIYMPNAVGNPETQKYPLSSFVDTDANGNKVKILCQSYIEFSVMTQPFAPFDLSKDADRDEVTKLFYKFITAVNSADKATLLAAPASTSAAANDADSEGMKTLEQSLPSLQRIWRHFGSGKMITSPFRFDLGEYVAYFFQTKNSDSGKDIYKYVIFKQNPTGVRDWASDIWIHPTALSGILTSITGDMNTLPGYGPTTDKLDGYAKISLNMLCSDPVGKQAASLYLKIIAPKGDTEVFSDKHFVDGKMITDDPKVSEVLSFYRTFLRAYAEIPNSSDLLDSQEMKKYLSMMSPGSVNMTLANAKNTEWPFIKRRDELVMTYRRVLAVIDANPLYYIVWTGLKGVTSPSSIEDIVLRKQDGSMQIVNQWSSSQFEELLNSKSVLNAIGNEVRKNEQK